MNTAIIGLFVFGYEKPGIVLMALKIKVFESFSMELIDTILADDSSE